MFSWGVGVIIDSRPVTLWHSISLYFCGPMSWNRDGNTNVLKVSGLRFCRQRKDFNPSYPERGSTTDTLALQVSNLEALGPTHMPNASMVEN